MHCKSGLKEEITTFCEALIKYNVFIYSLYTLIRVITKRRSFFIQYQHGMKKKGFSA